MLRLAVTLLLLANAGYYAWSAGWLAAWGLAPPEQTESYRLQQQIRPETLQILRARPTAPTAPPAGPAAPGAAPALPAASADASTAESAECLQAGVFDERQAEVLRAAAAKLPADAWQLEATRIPGRFMIYMGRFPDAEVLDRKRAELRARKISFDRAGGALEPGLSLGRFASEEQAQRELVALGNQGVRTARVVQERAEAPGFVLRLPAVTEALRPQLDALRPAMAGRTLRSC